MTAETNKMLGLPSEKFLSEFISEPAQVKRTPAEKVRILARLMLALAVIEKEEGCVHGNA